MNGSAPAMTISVLTQVLRWAEPPDPAITRLERRYCDVLGQRLGKVLAAICRVDPALGADLTARLAVAPEAQLGAWLLLPETSRRLVTRLHDFDDVRDHVRRVFSTEQPAPRHEAAMGKLAECIPVSANPPGDPRLPQGLRHAEHALALVSTACPPAGAFVRRVMRRLVLRVQEGGAAFASNSPQGLVGQAVLTNVHLPIVDDVVVAEALVHESIHGFVGMSEAIGLAGGEPDERWLADERYYEGFSCTVSPWTGKELDLPTYLHACFVWWGLLQLWASVSGTGLFDERRVRSRVVRAARGFMDRALLHPLLPHRAVIHPELLAGFETTSREVDELLAATGLDALMKRIEPATTR